jgi:N4-gp56 family major capsid protein
LDKSDPLGQKGIVGWKTYHKSFIANQAWMARLEVAASVL